MQLNIEIWQSDHKKTLTSAQSMMGCTHPVSEHWMRDGM